MKPITTWILVADGARARVYENAGPGKGLAPVAGASFAVDHPPSRDIGTERPGRVHESLGDGSRHAIAPRVDWHQHEKHLFAKAMARELGAASERYDRLVLVLPPKSLGELRAALDKTAAGKVVATLDKDLTNTPQAALADHIAPVYRL